MVSKRRQIFTTILGVTPQKGAALVYLERKHEITHKGPTFVQTDGESASVYLVESYFLFTELLKNFDISFINIARDWLRDGRSGDRIQMGARFSAPVHTGHGVHPASCTMGTGSFPVKGGRGVTLTPHPLVVPWSRKSRAIPLLPL